MTTDTEHMTETDTDTETLDEKAQYAADHLRENADYVVQLVALAILWVYAIGMSPPKRLTRATELEYLRFIAVVLTIIGITLLFVLVNQHGGDG